MFVRPLLSGLLLAIGVLSLWYSVVAGSTLVHRAIFALVPPDGQITAESRVAIDSAITRSVRYPGITNDLAGYPELSATEQAHLDDVLAVNGIILIYILPGAIVGLLLTHFRGHLGGEWPVSSEVKEKMRHALIWSIGLVGLTGLITMTGFSQVFVAIHPLLFPTGNWQLPSDQFVLTQVYPLGFFALAWGFILALSLLSLGIAHRLLRRQSAV